MIQAIKRVIEKYPEYSIIFEDNDYSFSEVFKNDYILIEVSNSYKQIKILRVDRRPCPDYVCGLVDDLKLKQNVIKEHQSVYLVSERVKRSIFTSIIHKESDKLILGCFSSLEKAKEFLETIPSYMLNRKPTRVVKSSTMINQKFCENDPCHTTIDAYYFIERLELDI